MYRGTVTVPQVTITTPDPCDQYEATVSAQYMMPKLTCTGNSSSKSLGGELHALDHRHRAQSRGDRGGLSHGLVVTNFISLQKRVIKIYNVYMKCRY